MKVSGYGSITSSGGVKKRGGASPVSAFSDLLALAETQSSAPLTATGDVAAPALLGGLLSLQEISGDEAERQKMVQQGKSLLDVLEKLRNHILLGAMPAHLLQDIASRLSFQKQSINDPKLLEIIGDIELRAAVELAKLENAFAAQAPGF